jgi:hypothetical protein
VSSDFSSNEALHDYCVERFKELGRARTIRVAIDLNGHIYGCLVTPDIQSSDISDVVYRAILSTVGGTLTRLRSLSIGYAP